MKRRQIEAELERLKGARIETTEETQSALRRHGSAELKKPTRASELIRRPELSYEAVSALSPPPEPLMRSAAEEVEQTLKYEGYIARQNAQIEQFKRLEAWKIPAGFDYERAAGLKRECREKLAAVQPASLGQASRISGVSPADISALMALLRGMRG